MKWVDSYKKLMKKSPIEHKNIFFGTSNVSENIAIVWYVNIIIDNKDINMEDIVKKYKQENPNIKVSMHDERNEEYERMAKNIKENNPYYALYSIKRIKEELHKEFAKWDYRVFSLENKNVKIKITKCYKKIFRDNYHEYYNVNIKDLKYEKLVNAYNAQLKKHEESKRKQNVKKALDF